jgi:hypothetical protein
LAVKFLTFFRDLTTLRFTSGDVGLKIGGVMEYTEIVNLLHHPVNLIKSDGSIVVIAPSGQSVRTARLMSWGEPKVTGTCLGVPIIEREKGSTYNMSGLNPNAYHIVSTMMARELCHPQFISPNTLDPTQVVRDGRNIIGVKSFQTFRMVENGNTTDEDKTV